MHVAFLEPHLRVAGGIRRVLELGNGLVRRGHQVTYLLPSSEPLACDWMECLGRIDHIEACFQRPFDVLVFNEEPQWSLMELFKRVELTVYYILHHAALYEKAGARESYRYPVDVRLANSNWTADRIEEEIGIRPTVLLGGINREHFRPVKVGKRYYVLTYGSDRYWKGTAEVEAACKRLGVRLERYEGKGLPQERMAQEYCRARVFAVGSYFEGFGQPGLEALACGVEQRPEEPKRLGSIAAAQQRADEVPDDRPLSPDVLDRLDHYVVPKRPEMPGLSQCWTPGNTALQAVCTLRSL